MLRACPHHGFSKLTQIDTFYNGLNEQDQDSLNATAGGNLLSKTTREALKIIKNKSKFRYSRSKLNGFMVNTNSRDSSSKTDDRIDKLAEQISKLVEIFNKQFITPATAKTVEKTCVICGGAHAYYDCIATNSNQPSVCAATSTYNQVSPPNRASNQIPPPGFAPVQNNQNRDFKTNIFKAPNNQVQPGIPNELSRYMISNESLIQNMQNQINVWRGDFNKQEENLKRNLNNDMRSILGSFFQNQASTSGTLPSNTVPNLKGEMKVVTTRSGLAYEGPSIPTNSPLENVVERDTKETTDKEYSNCQGSTAYIQPPTNDQKLREKATNQIEKFFQIFHDLHFDISFADALLLMLKFASTIKRLLTNKDKLFELAKVPLNENRSAMLLKKLPEKLRDPGKFLIPCDFPRIDVCHALADLGASINLMPLSIWKKLSLPELTPTRMTLELADRSITHLKGVAEDIFVKVGKFHFPTDFVVVDFEADPRVPLIFGRSFLRTGHALIDAYGEEITLRVNDESVTFNLNQTMRYSSTYDDNSVNRVDVIDIACEEFVQDVLDFQYNSKSSNPTPVSNPSFSEETKKIEDFLNDESIPMGIENSFYDPEADILFLEKLLNDDPFQLLPMDLKQAEETKAKSSIEKPPELELKELPSHLEYAFLEEIDKLPVIIAKDLKDDEKEALIKVLKSHKRAIAWKISNIKGQKISKFKIEVDRAKVDVIAKLHHPTTVKGVRSFLSHASFYRRFVQDFSKIARPMTHLLEKETPFVFSKECIDAFDTLKKNLTEALILVVPDWNLPFEQMCDASDFAIGAVLGQHHSAVKYLLSKQDAKSRLLWWVLLLQEFDIIIRDKKGSENLTADHLSRLENPHKDVLENKDINENFPLETLGSLSSGIDYLSKWVEVKALPTNDARIVVKFSKSLFSRFGTPRAIISVRRTYFCNDQFARVMTKYGVTHRLVTAYHPQTSGQVEVSNQRLKHILKRTVGENHALWSDKLDDALWAFCIAFKTPTGCTPYKLVYKKSCHLPIELEHKAYRTLKHVNFDLKIAGDHRKLQLNELNELRDQAYENSLIYKERTKKLHDSKIKNHIFNVGDRVLLFNSRLKIFLGKLKTRWSGPFTIT
nr:reverse transcriptase domain-containing protein [Tanacetum cinerariifolium]